MADIHNRSIPVYEDSYDSRITRIQPVRIGLWGFRELVRVNFSEKASFPIQTHIHPDAVEICYLFRGHQLYEVHGRQYALSGGDVYMTYPNEIHSSGENHQEKGELLYYMIIDTLNDTDRFLGLDEQNGRRLAQSINQMNRHFYVGLGLKSRFEEMIALYRYHPPFYDILFRSHTFLLLTELIERSLGSQPMISPQLLHLLEYIEDNIFNPPSISEMAGFVNWSESHFKMKFRKEIGITPAKYIMKRRLDYAKQFLREGVSITDIAYQLCFSSSQHFASAFRSHEGMSPSEWKSKTLNSDSHCKVGKIR